MFKGRNILIAPIDWGLGHATRCVPVIRSLMPDNRVLLGVTPSVESILGEEFPELERVQLPSYRIRYHSVISIWMKLVLSWPFIRRVMRGEHTLLERLIEQHGIDLVISDSRFGLYHPKIQTVLITHQLFLRSPVFPRLAQAMNRRFINRFKEVLVPDYEDDARSLSGVLSRGKLFRPVKYIGPQSRLRTDVAPVATDFLFIVSGPEPHRTHLERTFLRLAGKLKGNIAIVRGTHAKSKEDCGSVICYDMPSALLLSSLLKGASTVVCRSGYSTLMDLELFGRPGCILVPTPGQPEQEYLAQLWASKFGARTVSERALPGLFN